MPFKRILKDLVDAVPGARGAILADWEGEAVDQFSRDDEYGMKVTGAHKGIILTQLKEIHAKLYADSPREAIITTDQQHVLIGAIGPDYSLVMTTDEGSVVGLALRRFRVALALMEKEIC